MVGYARLHDDHDGTNRGDINIMFSPDGDARVWTTDREGRELEALRFRTPAGGGMSQRTRTALIILAEAIRLDNEGPVR